MSLHVDDRRDRHRSRSRSRDRRSRDDPEREAAPAAPSYADVREPSYAYPQDDLDSAYRSSRRGDAPSGGLPYPSDGGVDSMYPGDQALYSYDASRARGYDAPASPPTEAPYRVSRDSVPGAFPDEDADSRRRDRGEDSKPSRRDSERDRRDDKPKHLPPRHARTYSDAPESPRTSRPDRLSLADPLSFLPAKYSRKLGLRGDDDDDDDDDDDAHGSLRERRARRKEDKARQDEEDLAYGRPHELADPSTGDERRRSRHARDSGQDDPRDAGGSYREAPTSPRDSYRQDPRDAPGDVLSVAPPTSTRSKSPSSAGSRAPRPSVLTVDAEPRDRDRSRDRRHPKRDRSPQPPGAPMASLTVDTGRSSTASLSLANAPGSPLLESYHGTYQACSPMPSPLLIASPDPGHAEPLSPLSDDRPRSARRARFHDPQDIASQLARALRGDGPPDTQPLIDILPSLTHDQVMELRTEYKRLVKTGSARRGVNIAKHIRARLKDDDPALMKACYAVALGRWEAEAYWANFWYQGDKTRRELLIESLLGRTNAEVARIKLAFSDKKYDNSLVKCMRTELKEDKFKKAVLLALEARRMDDTDDAGRPLPLDRRLVDRDADDLHRCVKADKGGESAMIAIVVQRSDAHLRAVLKAYERAYRGNFARDALKKSGNLVGELLAHILNGVINRPVRDALLLHHALTASRKDDLRRELLTSRLVRFHWDAAHMAAVRRAYRERYGRELQDAVREATAGPWGMFCRDMCIARAPDDVRRFDKVESIR